MPFNRTVSPSKSSRDSMAEGVRPIMLWPPWAEGGVWITVRVFFVLPCSMMAMLMSSERPSEEARGLAGVAAALDFFFDDFDFFFLGESPKSGEGGQELVRDREGRQFKRLRTDFSHETISEVHWNQW